MRIPTITGVIGRRILINYQVEAEVLQRYLPMPFRPLTVAGKGIAGICLIRLKQIRPKGMPAWMGIGSENGAHRIAVQWTEDGRERKGVYIPRRDTSSILNALAGGRIFSGVHHYANFSVHEDVNHYKVAFNSADGTSLAIEAERVEEWNAQSVFDSLKEASCFFESGSVGYSPDAKPNCFDGLELNTLRWEVAPLKVTKVYSSFFSDERIFPKGSVTLDNALLMENIPHEWRALPILRRTPYRV